MSKITQILDNIIDKVNTHTGDLSANNGASELVRLDATGKLPAIDGSQLTGLPSGGGGGGAWELIQTVEITSPVTSIEFTSIGTYNCILIVFHGVYTGSVSAINFSASSDNGATYIGAYGYTFSYEYRKTTQTTQTIVNSESNAAGDCYITAPTYTYAQDDVICGKLFVYDLKNTSARTSFVSESVSNESSSTSGHHKSFGIIRRTSDLINAIRLTATAGTIDGGTFSLYGLTQ